MKSSILCIFLLGPCICLASKLRPTLSPKVREQAGLEFTKVGELPGGQNYRQELKNIGNLLYTGEFHVGGQRIDGIFDTGSFDLVVRSSRCQECLHPTPPYSHEKSATYSDAREMSEFEYGSGPVTVRKGFDNVSVGDGTLFTKKQSIYEIVSHSIPLLDHDKFAAIVGIGPAHSFDNKDQTLLMNFGINEFSICLEKNSLEKGWLTWGPVPGTAGLKAARVLGKHHWGTRLRKASFSTDVPKREGLYANPCADGVGCIAIIDSGTSLLSAPRKHISMLKEQIGNVKEDCSNLHELPDLTFELDGIKLTLPPQAYIMREKGLEVRVDSWSDLWNVWWGNPKSEKVDRCVFSLMELEDDWESSKGPMWIFGMPFFRYYHTTFNRKERTMSFAKAGDGCYPEGGAVNEASFALWKKDPKHTALEIDKQYMMPPRITKKQFKDSFS
eukprot:TRINITY_DN79411_c0_g1_i1.p1 TRINITY_DN79411_c0_g1~~TRINITY_DN79411_c0_g1_i1.p1  ORF type:complete len:443 (+),score=69.15 TRINITY_DN79411_c0_g1_i1:119-1447(+)